MHWLNYSLYMKTKKIDGPEDLTAYICMAKQNTVVHIQMYECLVRTVRFRLDT